MAANQSRRRIELIYRPGTPSSQHETGAFSYDGLRLDESTDCIRLIRIERAEKNSDPLCCFLFNVKFSDRPRYDALSYMWGDASAGNKIILLNGVEFSVTKNLFDALRYLRWRGKNGPVWVDAICINQEDVPERNRQLRMMPHIYFRASTVLVWLGEKYSEFTPELKDAVALRPGSLTRLFAWVTWSTVDVEPHPGSVLMDEVELRGMISGSFEDLLKNLCTDDYWERLWIIQEIGKSQQREICFGTMAIEWSSFASLASRYNSGANRPRQLSQQLDAKYLDGHKLLTLLRNHQASKCSEPRDKVYGLVGLASDASGFPIDYAKTLLEVWVDTMNAVHGSNSLHEADILPTGRLLRQLLMGDGVQNQEQSSYSPRGAKAKAVRRSPVFRLKGYVLGYIHYIGPSATEIVSSTSKADEWTASLQRNYRGSDELGDANRENDLLTSKLLKLNDAQTAALCSSYVSPVEWHLELQPRMFHLWAKYDTETKAKRKASAAARLFPAASTSTPDNPAIRDAAPSLYQLKSAHGDTTRWKTGIASSQAAAGDLVCSIVGTRTAVVLRLEVRTIDHKDTRGNVQHRSLVRDLRVVGTALVTEDLVADRRSRQPHHTDRFDSYHWSNDLHISMDARTVFDLL